MDDFLKNVVKEEVEKFLLKEYSSITPYKENLSKMVNDIEIYFNDIKKDIISRKQIGDEHASLHDVNVIMIEKYIRQLKNAIEKVH